MSEVRRQIERAEQRWRRSADAREACHGEMCKVRRGEDVDWRRLDQPSRIARRLERLGDYEAAEAMMDRSSTDFNPLERILRANELTGVEFFERGLIAARAVARIEIRGPDGRLLGYGSGVMVSPRLLLTNNHVLTSNTDAAGSVAQFEYLTTANGIALEPRSFRLEPQTFFITNEALDFTLVAVEPRNVMGDELTSRGWCPLISGSGKAIVGERVNIIQHPGGERMQVTVRDNTIVAVVSDFLQYEADTRPGSSGSPVFNEQWEMAALHHAGVPRRDSRGRILMRDGSPWTGRREDVDRIEWEANEGVRISRIVAHVEGQTLNQAERSLWQEAFAPPRPLNLWDLFRNVHPEAVSRPDPSAITPATAADDGQASWLFRLSFGPATNGVQGTPSMSVSAGSQQTPAASSTSERPRPISDARPVDRTASLAEQLFEQFRHDGPYYDAAEDEAAAARYWSGVDWCAPADALFAKLSQRLEETHGPRHSYARARHEFLYPAIDLHADGQLKNIYSGTVLDPREVMARELAEVLPRAEALGFETSRLDINALLDNDELWEAVEAETLGEETATAFNCEHVVCQSWFGKRQPMKADIHHLFTCEPGCNSFRSNIPYWSFAPEEEIERDRCGRREGNKFEPEHGRGVVARATMYFVLRYPGEVGDRRSELTKSRINVLLKWHNEESISEYERHRNWLTEKAQGNRNPFIDYPEAATNALLALGFSTS